MSSEICNIKDRRPVRVCGRPLVKQIVRYFTRVDDDNVHPQRGYAYDTGIWDAALEFQCLDRSVT